MAELLGAVLDAHGGLDNWRRFHRVEATIVTGGELWGIKDQRQDALPRNMTVALDHEWASLRPFGADDQKTDFTIDRVAIEKFDGRVVAERVNPRDPSKSSQEPSIWPRLPRMGANRFWCSNRNAKSISGRD